MGILLISLISSVFLSGTIGYISYWILQETAYTYYSDREKDDKNAFIALLSLSTFLILFLSYNLILLYIDTVAWVYFWSIVTTSICMMILNFFILPKIFKYLYEINNVKRKKELLAVFSRKSKRNVFFEENKNRYIYMFTLTGEYITSGTLISTTLESDMYQEYILQSGDSESVRTIPELEKNYSEELIFDIFVDVENNIQIYSCDII